MKLNRVLWTVILYAAFFLNTTANNNGFDAIYAVLDGWSLCWLNIQTAIIHLVSYQQTRGWLYFVSEEYFGYPILGCPTHFDKTSYTYCKKKKTTKSFDFGSPVSMFFTLSEAADFGKTRVGSQETSKLNPSRPWAECASIVAEKKKESFFDHKSSLQRTVSFTRFMVFASLRHSCFTDVIGSCVAPRGRRRVFLYLFFNTTPSCPPFTRLSYMTERPEHQSLTHCELLLITSDEPLLLTGYSSL